VNADKQLSAKKAWGALNERARLGEKFGAISLVGLMIAGGYLTKPEAAKLLNEAGVTLDDIQKFDAQRRIGKTPDTNAG
jgi:hypothetical protein